MNPLLTKALKGGDAVMYRSTPCTPLETLAETIRLRQRYRRRWPDSARLPIIEKDVLRQCQELGIAYVSRFLAVKLFSNPRQILLVWRGFSAMLNSTAAHGAGREELRWMNVGLLLTGIGLVSLLLNMESFHGCSPKQFELRMGGFYHTNTVTAL